MKMILIADADWPAVSGDTADYWINPSNILSVSTRNDAHGMPRTIVTFNTSIGPLFADANAHADIMDVIEAA